MKNKKIIFICVFIIIFIIIISIFYYKKQNSGNNISIIKSVTDYKQNILNISSYEATISVEIISNKNTNKYIIKQWYNSPNIFKQEVQAPENIKGLVTLYDGSNLEIQNTNLNLSKIYNDYNCLSNNILSLNSFIQDLKENDSECTETENETTIEIETKKKYAWYKRLIISKETGEPTKMEILDENKNTLVYILYNEITINSTNKKDIM